MFRLERISKNYGTLKVFQGLSMEFPVNRITAILGPSGCGKTTILNILAGLTKADQGTVVTAGKVGYLFQEPRLLPWLTAFENVAIVLEDKMPGALVEARAREYLKAVGLEEYTSFYPNQLSGGMKQRVAMARAFSYSADLLLMDEPFKSLDLKNRLQLIRDFLTLWQKEVHTVVMVTHDIKEAAWLGEHILVLSEKPARIIKRIENNIPFDKRWTGEESFQLEQELWKLLLAE